MKIDKIHWDDLHIIPYKDEIAKREGIDKILADKINELVDENQRLWDYLGGLGLEVLDEDEEWDKIQQDYYDDLEEQLKHDHEILVNTIIDTKNEEKKKTIKKVKKGFKKFNNSYQDWEDFRDELLRELEK